MRFVARLWCASKGECLFTFVKHTAEAVALAWLPSGSQFLSGGNDQNIILWASSGQVLHIWHGVRVSDLVLDASGTQALVSCTDKKVHQYDLKTYRLVTGAACPLAWTSLYGSFNVPVLCRP